MKYIKFFILIFMLTMLINVKNVYADSLVDSAYNVPDFENLIRKDDGTYYDYFIQARNFHKGDSSIARWHLYILKSPITNNVYFNADCYKHDYVQIVTSYCYYFNDDEWTHLGYDDYSGYLTIGYPYEDYNNQYYDEAIIYSSFDLMCNGEVVFQKPRTSLRTLFQMIPRTIMTGVLSQLAYLIPCLISLVIGLLAFRKAWNFLRKVLVV